MMHWSWASYIRSFIISQEAFMKLSIFTEYALADGVWWWLGLQAVKPKDFAMQINLAMENCWGIVRALVDVVAALEDGSWLLVKDPNKPLLRLYSVPPDAFKVQAAQPKTELHIMMSNS